MSNHWIKTSTDYYTSNLMAHDIPADIIGIIILFVVQNLQIGDLVNVPSLSHVWDLVYTVWYKDQWQCINSRPYYDIKQRYKSKHSPKRRSNYMHNCIVIRIGTRLTDDLYELHYIGWPEYKAWVHIKDIKPFISNNWETMDYKNLLNLSVKKKFRYPHIPYDRNIYNMNIHNVILFVQQDKKITKEITTTFPLKLPNHIYLCSDIRDDNILYLFAKLHPNGYQ